MVSSPLNSASESSTGFSGYLLLQHPLPLFPGSTAGPALPVSIAPRVISTSTPVMLGARQADARVTSVLAVHLLGSLGVYGLLPLY